MHVQCVHMVLFYLSPALPPTALPSQFAMMGMAAATMGLVASSARLGSLHRELGATPLAVHVVTIKCLGRVQLTVLIVQPTAVQMSTKAHAVGPVALNLSDLFVLPVAKPALTTCAVACTAVCLDGYGGDPQACQACPSGWYASDVGTASQCLECGFGQVSQAGSSSCTVCPAHSVPNNNKSECGGLCILFAQCMP